MKWENIISISGKPGLYRIIGRSKSGILAEGLEDKRKVMALPLHVSVLGDIAVFTDTDEIRLPGVFERMHRVGNVPPKKAPKETLVEFFEKVIPDYDRTKFYPSHMRKIADWYHIMQRAGILEELLKDDSAGEKDTDEDAGGGSSSEG